METVKKPNFYIKVWKSITDPKFYSYFISESLGKAFGYFLLFSLLVGLISGTIIANKTKSYINEAIDFTSSDKMHEFHISNGELYVDIDEPYIYEDERFIFIIDMNEQYTYNDLAGYETGYLLTPKIIYMSQVGTQPLPLNLEDFKDLYFDNESLVNFLEYSKKILVVPIIITILIGLLFMNLITSFFSSIIALIFNSIFETRLTYSQLYNISIYALTLPTIVIVITINGPIFALPAGLYILLYYCGISGYIIAALKSLKKSQEII